MKEIEVKILNIDIANIEAKIKQLGGKKIADDFLIDRVFDTPEGTLKQTKSLLRLRTNGTTSFLTFKNNASIQNGIRTTDEYETAVDNADIMHTILTSLGYEQIRYREKKRISYLLGEVRIEIDEYPTIPPYIELEGTEENIPQTVTQLGFTMQETVPWTVTELLTHYKQDEDYQAFSGNK